MISSTGHEDQSAMQRQGVRRSLSCESDAAFAEESQKRFFLPRGWRNPLESLDSDKRIQGNPWNFLGGIWLFCGITWLGFEKFGLGLERTQFQERHNVTNMVMGLLMGGARLLPPAAIVRTAAARSEGGPQSTRVDQHGAAAMSGARAGERRLLSWSYFRAILNRDGRLVVPAAARRGGVVVLSPCAMS